MFISQNRRQFTKLMIALTKLDKKHKARAGYLSLKEVRQLIMLSLILPDKVIDQLISVCDAYSLLHDSHVYARACKDLGLRLIKVIPTTHKVRQNVATAILSRDVYDVYASRAKTERFRRFFQTLSDDDLDLLMIRRPCRFHYQLIINLLLLLYRAYATTQNATNRQ